MPAKGITQAGVVVNRKINYNLVSDMHCALTRVLPRVRLGTLAERWRCHAFRTKINRTIDKPILQPKMPQTLQCLQ